MLSYPHLRWKPDEREIRRVFRREDVVVQWPDTVVVDGEPIQVKEREMVVVPEGDFVHYEMEMTT